MKSAGTDIFQLSFQVCPIILTQGVAQLVPGQMLPIISITEALNFVNGLISGDDSLSLDNFFAHYAVLPGAGAISNQYGKYPFANQSVAANAVIAEPLRVSLLMTCPARAGGGGFAAKLATMTALQATLELHSNLGGTYTVLTPSLIYTNLLLNDLKSAGDTNTQKQTTWQWDFERPLLTEEEAASAFNGMMGRISQGLPSTGALSGAEVAGSPLSLATPGVAPAAQGLTGSNVASFAPT